VRTFLAIQLPEDVKQGLSGMQGQIEAGAGGFYRWSRAEQMHLTLYFLGEMEGPPLAKVMSSLDALGGEKISLAVGGLVLLPEPLSPRIVAAGVKGEVAKLRGLHQKLSDTVFPWAAFKATRAFSPHITVGRLKPGMPGNAKALKRTLAEASLPDSPRFVVSEYELVSSTLGKQGPTYETVHRFALR
jgi:2'-5' RNA ligase